MSDYKDDPYQVLGIPTTATDAEVKKAYRKLALVYHPDKHIDPVEKEKAQAKFCDIAHAYEILLDENLKKEYLESCAPPENNNGKNKGSGTSSGAAGSSSTIPKKKFRPHFTDPYAIFLRDFEDQFGFPYPGSQYDYIDPKDWKPAPNQNKQIAGGPSAAKKTPSQPQPPPDPSKVKERALVAHGGTQIVEAEESPGINNRPIAMETTVRQEGPITITTHTFKRPDGSTETMTMRTGIPGKAPPKDDKKLLTNGDNDDKKLLTNGDEKKLLTNGKEKKLLTNGDEKKENTKKSPQKKENTKELPQIANHAHADEKPARKGVLGWFGKKKSHD